MKKFIILCGMIILCSYLSPLKGMAAEANNNLTTITIGASDDESGNLMYAIDSDDPNAFTTSNEFVVEAGSSHTVYVKDAAGNISSQVITAPIEKVGIEVTIGQDDTDSALGTARAGKAVSEAAEKGGGTVNEKTITDGSSSSEKIFYTITTPNENVFYMVIDNTRTSDNVYLLNKVTEEDLLALAEGGDAKKTKETIFNSAPADTEVVSSSDVASDTSKEDTKQNSKSDLPIIILVVLVVGGVYYYLKVYKPKKAAEMDLADAMDIDEFETEEDGSEEDEIIFEESEAKERLLRKITNEAMDIENEKSINENDMPSIDVADQEFLNMSLEDFEREMDEVVDMEMVQEAFIVNGDEQEEEE